MDPVEVLVLFEPQVRSLVTLEEAREAVRAAFVALADGRAVQPASLDLEAPGRLGEMHVKGSYLTGEPFFSLKAASGFYGNRDRGLPVTGGLSLAFDAESGFLRALLFDNGWLTEVRTGAAGALAADLLARPDVGTVAIIGSGGQARFQLAAVLEVRSPTRVMVWSPTAERAEAYASEMRVTHDLEVLVAASAEEAVRDADLVVTATPATEPVVRAEWVRPGTHVTAVGSDFPNKQELDVGLLAGSRVVADQLGNCLRSGEVHHAVEAGVISVDDVVELGDVVTGRAPGRTDDEQITIADLCGLGIEDTAMANLVLRRALERGIGERLSV
jgi:ornithine cyclodeaminase/alanine dehydrogenase-like protein (mu-crystallin family)